MLEDLYAKVVVLDDGQTQVAMVVCDLITVPRHTVLEARKLIEQQTKIPGSHVMISATHTHTGPVLARETARDDSDGGSGDLAKKYTAELPAMIAQGVAEASGRLVPVRTSFAHGHEDRMAFTRRFLMKDGTVGWNPGKNNPNIIRPVSPIDPEVQVITLGRDLAWVALGGEVFVELGLSIKAASPFQQTHVVELANGSFSYIPNRSAYAG